MEDEAHRRVRSRATGAETGEQGRATSAHHAPDVSISQQSFEAEQQLAQRGNPRGVLPAMDMSNMAGALPDYSYHGQSQQLYAQQVQQSGANTSMMYPYPQSQYTSNTTQNFAMPFPQQPVMQGYQTQRVYGPYPNAPAVTNQYPGQVFYQPNMMGPGSIQTPFQQFQQNPAYGALTIPTYSGHGGGQYQATHAYSGAMGPNLSPHQYAEPQDLRRNSSGSSLQSPTALRGPPRKPKQSGHALWVGNLPPGTNILDLKDHFCRDATNDIESVFLISKSNCAFVNYKTEQSCSAAMSRFHDSRFLGVRLVCRLRKGSAPGVAPATASTRLEPGDGAGSQENIPEGRGDDDDSSDVQARSETMPTTEKVKERFFIIKSLTIEDLERSVHSGIWATQSHNETALNRAYQTAENVYLIFSANKSGEYFGYARMDTAIDDQSSPNIELSSLEFQIPQQMQSASASDVPLKIPTPATATAPKGHVIDDSARGTIFWEAESVEEMEENISDEHAAVAGELEQSDALVDDPSDDPSASPSKPTTPQSTTFGKPFKITWMSTDRLPFYRTRGLRNPWNTNREVKIARDGTELEPSVGRKLVSMFGNTSSNIGGRPHQQSQYPHPSLPSMHGPGQGPAYRPF